MVEEIWTPFIRDVFSKSWTRFSAIFGTGRMEWDVVSTFLLYVVPANGKSAHFVCKICCFLAPLCKIFSVISL